MQFFKFLQALNQAWPPRAWPLGGGGGGGGGGAGAGAAGGGGGLSANSPILFFKDTIHDLMEAKNDARENVRQHCEYAIWHAVVEWPGDVSMGPLRDLVRWRERCVCLR